MIIEKVDEEISLVIIKTFKIQSCVCGFCFFQDSWQPKLREILNASNEDHPSFLIHGRYAIAHKDKNGKKTIGHVPKYVSKQMHFFIKYCGRVKMKMNGKRRYFVNPLSTKKCYTGLKNMIKMYCQRNENRIRKFL